MTYDTRTALEIEGAGAKRGARLLWLCLGTAAAATGFILMIGTIIYL